MQVHFFRVTSAHARLAVAGRATVYVEPYTCVMITESTNVLFGKQVCSKRVVM